LQFPLLSVVTPEGKVKAMVKRLLEKHDAYWFCPVQNGMGAPGLDFMHIQIAGVPVFAIETKAPGEKPTVRQERTIKKIRAAGGTVFVIDGDTQELEQWLQIRRQPNPCLNTLQRR
jgi:hypothetical protein